MHKKLKKNLKPTYKLKHNHFYSHYTGQPAKYDVVIKLSVFSTQTDTHTRQNLYILATRAVMKANTGVGTTLMSTAKLVRCSHAHVVWVTFVSNSRQPNVDHWPDIVLSKSNITSTSSSLLTQQIN